MKILIILPILWTLWTLCIYRESRHQVSGVYFEGENELTCFLLNALIWLPYILGYLSK